MPQDELAVYEKCGSYQGTLHSLTPGLAGEVVESTTIYLTLLRKYIYACTLYPAHNHNAPSGITRQCIDSKRFSAHDYVFSVKSHSKKFHLFFRHSAAWLHLCWMRHLQHVLHHTCYLDAYQRAGCPVRHKDKGQRFCSYVYLSYFLYGGREKELKLQRLRSVRMPPFGTSVPYTYCLFCVCC